MQTTAFPFPRLKSFARDLFLAMGCPEADAELAATVLLSADLRGIDSHGIARLSGYVRLWKTQRINTCPELKIVHETPTTATVDGDSGLGLVIAPRAMEIAMDKAANSGSGWISVRNSNHFGIAGYHAMMGLSRDMIGLAMTNASPLVTPTFSRERMLGTNPIAVAIPAGEEPPFVADMATTTVANGKLEVLKRQGRQAESGWVQDKKGYPTTAPEAVKEGGALLPLGGDRAHGSHKGYALGAWVDIFSGVLSGANFGPWVPPFVSYLPLPEDPVGKGIGHFLGAMRVDGFQPASVFKANMDRWIRRFHTAEPAPGETQVLVPGDPERRTEQERLKTGIPLLPAVVADLEELSKTFAVAL